MTRRLIVANFGSMHQTSIQVTNMLLNMLGSDAEFNTISILRDEVARILAEENNGWTKAKVPKMIKADCVARETLRLHSFGGRVVFRKVLVDVETDGGVKLSRGFVISLLSQSAHTDETIFDKPDEFDPFRFSRMREAMDHGKGGADASTRTGNLSFVTTSTDHLAFGHGKHACPGQFLIDFELKVIIAYVLSHYDVKFPDIYNGMRTENF